MMTQSVMTQTANLFGNATGSVASKGKQVGSGFDLIIDSNLKSGQKVQGNKEKELSIDKKTSLHNTKTKDNNKSDATDGNANQTKSVTSKDSAKIDDTKPAEEVSKQTVKTVDTGKTKGTKDEVIEDGQAMAQIAGMLQSIRQAVMQTLDLTSEELDQLLMDQGMNVTDLLQPEHLQQLVLVSNGETDILAALTDEGLAETMKQLLETVDGIKTDANLQISEEQLKLLLAKVQEQTGTQEVVEVENNDSIINSENQTTLAEKLAKQQEGINSTNAMMEDDELSSSTEGQKVGSVEGSKLNGTSESSTGAQTDGNKKDNQDLKSADQFQIFVDNLVKTQVTKVDMSGNLVQVTELRDIANQIVERIKVSIQPDQTSMELQLNPENLGKVNLSIQSKNGVMTAQFVVQSEISKEAIESQLHILRETLDQQGIKVEAIEVTVSTYAFDQNQESSDNQPEAQKNNSGNRISLEDAFNMNEIDEEDAMTEDITGVRGSQVDYTA